MSVSGFNFDIKDLILSMQIYGLINTRTDVNRQLVKAYCCEIRCKSVLLMAASLGLREVRVLGDCEN